MSILKIGLLGGSFNPVHKGHINLALIALKTLHLDKLLLIPNANPPHKSSVNIAFDIRYNMLKEAIKGHNNIDICDIEKDAHEKHYTFDTLTKLKECYKDSSLYFILGTDSLLSLDKWYRGYELLNLSNIICMKRKCDALSLNTIDPKLKAYILNNCVYTKDIATNKCVDDNNLHANSFDLPKVTTQNKIFILENDTIDISSTTLRETIQRYYQSNLHTDLEFLKNYLNKDVLNSILNMRLYNK